jgi:hypothetical protein
VVEEGTDRESGPVLVVMAQGPTFTLDGSFLVSAALENWTVSALEK